jgi:nucleotide-binding universal stress UspA family protein
MIKTVLVHLRGTKGDAATLSAALQVARPFAAHLECLHVRPDPGTLITRAAAAEIDASITMKMLNDLQKQAAESAERAFAAYSAFCADAEIERGEIPPILDNMSAAFREDIGSELDRLIAHSRRHDLVVVKGGDESDGGLGSAVVGRLILSSGRPVLLAPSVPSRPICIVAIAWKDTPEAARAVTAAMPILETARDIAVISAGEGDEPVSDQQGVTTQLQWHGLAVTAHRVEPRGRDAHDAVLEAARAADADLLVTGGYGHNRLREIVFGGFTQGLLDDASLPVLFLH